jgi:DNA-binding NtrC family response regulator
VLCDGPRIETRHLPASVVPAQEKGGVPPVPGSTIAELERYAILKTLEACGGSTSKAATVLGVSPRKIQYKLHEYALSPEDGSSASLEAARDRSK